MKKQRGIALPVALIMFVVMLMGGLYLARSVGSSSITVGNMAYQRVLSRVADRGLLRAYDWLNAAFTANPAQLNANVPAAGYVASFPLIAPQIGPEDAAFWVGSIQVPNVDNNGNDVQYVIHRMCSLNIASSAIGNNCIKSTFQINPDREGEDQGLPAGEGIRTSALIHYLITSRVINTRKGTTAINQFVVMMES